MLYGLRLSHEVAPGETLWPQTETNHILIQQPLVELDRIVWRTDAPFTFAQAFLSGRGQTAKVFVNY